MNAPERVGALDVAMQRWALKRSRSAVLAKAIGLAVAGLIVTSSPTATQIVGAILVGLFIQLSTLVIPIELQAAGVLGILVIVLLIRPQGILGRRERVG